MTTNPQLPEFDPNLRALADQFLASGLIDTGGIQFGVRFGKTTLTWSAAVTSNTVTITHGLGKTPASVLTGITVITGGSSRVDVFVAAASVGASSFTLTGVLGNQAVAATGTATAYWAVVG